MEEYCDELDKLNNEEDPFKLNTMTKNNAEDNNDMNKDNAEENNDVAKNHAEENIDLNEWPGWGLPPAANPWAERGKPGGPPGPVQRPPHCHQC